MITLISFIEGSIGILLILFFFYIFYIVNKVKKEKEEKLILKSQREYFLSHESIIEEEAKRCYRAKEFDKNKLYKIDKIYYIGAIQYKGSATSQQKFVCFHCIVVHNERLYAIYLDECPSRFFKKGYSEVCTIELPLCQFNKTWFLELPLANEALLKIIKNNPRDSLNTNIINLKYNIDNLALFDY